MEFSERGVVIDHLARLVFFSPIQNISTLLWGRGPDSGSDEEQQYTVTDYLEKNGVTKYDPPSDAADIEKMAQKPLKNAEFAEIVHIATTIEEDKKACFAP